MVLVLSGLGAAVDGFWIEPFRIKVTRHHIQAPLAAPLKIAHLSDLHTYGVQRRERRLISLLQAEQPDLIVITGDTITRDGTYAMCWQLLSRLQAPLGVWLVRGNLENDQPFKNEHAFYGSAGVHFLLNEAQRVRDDLWIVGLDDASSGLPDWEVAMKDIPSGAYTITLFHAPAYFDKVAGHSPLVLAGHTHGGQVRIPLVTTFWLPRDSGRYLEGWYEKNGSRMYVSRGIGTSVIPVRFLCRPELAIITLGN